MNDSIAGPPEYDGRCAFAVSLGKLDVPGKDSLALVQHGKRYVFSNPIARLLWRLLPGRHSKAAAHWRTRA
jgi:hypothetical protein